MYCVACIQQCSRSCMKLSITLLFTIFWQYTTPATVAAFRIPHHLNKVYIIIQTASADIIITIELWCTLLPWLKRTGLHGTAVCIYQAGHGTMIIIFYTAWGNKFTINILIYILYSLYLSIYIYKLATADNYNL